MNGTVSVGPRDPAAAMVFLGGALAIPTLGFAGNTVPVMLLALAAAATLRRGL